jgi:hypothetical protein
MPARQRAWFGASGGARLGIYLSIVGGLAAMVVRRESAGPLLPIRFATTILVGMIFGGIIFALGRPRVRNSWGGALLGTASIAPALFALPIVVRGFPILWTSVVSSAILSLVVGGLLGMMAWRGWTRTHRTDLAA